DATDSSVTLALHLPDGAGGFPGNRLIRATFSAHAPATLRLSVTVQTDAPTLINLANHSYWNLDASPDWSGHTLRIAAQDYLPATDAFTPTGIIAPVEGTPYDFRNPTRIVASSPALDTCFCLSDRRQSLRDVLWLTGTNGTTMTVATTEPGVQVYDARGARRPGRSAYEGLAIEPQFWPDAPNHPHFPDITLAPGQPWTQISEWRFTAA
ncbi:MAG: galactose mutarotase, partial [Paracoccaceae bacterium]|nr:galactose mutarotase [Paracoccaceae bacterium]